MIRCGSIWAGGNFCLHAHTFFGNFAFRKVIENHMQPVGPSDADQDEQGRWFGFKNVED